MSSPHAVTIKGDLFWDPSANNGAGGEFKVMNGASGRLVTNSNGMMRVTELTIDELMKRLAALEEAYAELLLLGKTCQCKGDSNGEVR